MMLVQYLLENSAEKHPDKLALICDERRATYREINDKADHLAAGLAEQGTRPGDRVVIFLENSIEAVVSIFGILKAGAVFVILNPGMKSRKLNYILKDAGAKTLVTHQDKLRVVTEAIRDFYSLHHVILVQDREKSSPEPPAENAIGKTRTVQNWNDVLNTSVPRYLYEKPPRIDIDLAALIYTSGSTGDPKGVMCAHRSMVAAATSIVTYLENTEDDIILNALPLSFDYGLYQVLMAFLFGGTLVLEKSFMFAGKSLRRIAAENVTGFPIVPTMAAILLQLRELGKVDFSSLRYVTNTAAALPAAVIGRLQKLWPHVKIYSMYGLTECKRVSYLPPQDLERKPESVGIPMPNEDVSIVDDQGNKLGPGQTGELVIRGTNVMQGYWNAPEETARVFRSGHYPGDTWLYSGDLFRQDQEKYLYFIARKDDLIKTRGERVSPKEIETILYEIDGVAEAAVIGIPDEILGQAIKAFIVTENGFNLTAEQVLNHCRSQLEQFMIPKHIEFRSSLPKTTSGKIDKKNIK